MTRYERLKRKLLDNWLVACLVIAAGILSWGLGFLEQADRVWRDWSLRKTDLLMTVTVEEGGECGPSPVSVDIDERLRERATMDIGINNNSDRSIMLSTVRLIPDWVTGGFYMGELEPTKEYTVLVDPWLELVEIAQAYSPLGEAGRAQLVAAGKAKAERVGDRESKVWWVRPDPLEVKAIPEGKYTVGPRTAERFRIRLGLSRSIDFVIATGVVLEIQTDRGDRLRSKPQDIAVCVP